MSGEVPPSTFEYVVSGLDSKCRRQHLRIEAESPKAAKEEAVLRGFTEVEIHTDDLLRSAGLGNAGKTIDPKYRVTPKHEVALLRASPFQARLLLARHLYRDLFLPIAAISILLALILWHKGLLGIAWWIVGLLAFPLALAFLVPLNTSVLLKADELYYQADWQALLELVPRMRKACASLPPDAFAMMVVQKEAPALLRLGRREDAFQLVETLRSQGVSEKIVEMRLASLFTMCGEYDRADECYRRALESSPGEWMPRAMYADFLATFVNKPQEARRIMATVDLNQLSQESKWAVTSNEAIILLMEGRYEAAREALTKVLEHVSGLRPSGPGWKGTYDYYAARLAVALLKTGRRDEAQRLYDQTEPFLTRHKLDAVLQLCAGAGLRRSG